MTSNGKSPKKERVELLGVLILILVAFAAKGVESAIPSADADIYPLARAAWNVIAFVVDIVKAFAIFGIPLFSGSIVFGKGHPLWLRIVMFPVVLISALVAIFFFQ